MNFLVKILLSLLVLYVTVSQTVTPPIDAIGTVIPRFQQAKVSPYRAFNDLMKQSLQLVPYKLQSWGGIGRCWSCSLNYIDNLSHKYPANLPQFIWAVAEIPFLDSQTSFLNQVFNVKYSGKGIVGVYQSTNPKLNTTWNNGNGGQFTLTSINQSLFVYIYTTDPTDPVRSISITLASLGTNPSTFNQNFINYLKPFNLLRTCYWQGQNLYNSGQSTQLWNRRVLPQSSTQIMNPGVALQHILQLQVATGATLWPCIPDTADSNYITQMAQLFNNLRDKTKLMYLQFGNVYTIMNDIPDYKTNPVFTTFMNTYGSQYRSKVLFTINYKDVQYYINAMGMRSSPPINFTYIDAIGFQPNFGTLDIADVNGASSDQIKSNLTHKMLSYQLTVNRAYQISKWNGTNLITFSGGPYIKTYRYGYIFKNKTNSSYTDNATKELNLAYTLNDMNLQDNWVGEFYLQWIARLRSMGVKSILFSQLLSGAFTYDTDIVGLVPYLNMTTPAYKALSEFVFGGRKTNLPTFGTVPSNPFTCIPNCVWGDCVNNACSCYSGYSGTDCSIYTPPNNQNKIGTNLQGISYWNTQHPFIDLHKQGSQWVYFLNNNGWNSGLAFKDQVPLDQNGYPKYLPPGIAVGTLMSRDVKTHYDQGNYTILYDGDGILRFGMFDIKSVIYGIGKCIVNVVPTTDFNNGLLVVIERTNPANPIRNIRVIRPGYQNTWWTQKFSPLLLEKLAPYGTLRFMDWTNTNSQTDQNWEDRVKSTHRTYTKNGIAWEDAIHLSNLLGKDMWINIPHLASDDYITQLANLVLSKLEPHLKVHVEYSNQIWGTLFPGGKYTQNKGITYYQGVISDPTQARFCMLSLTTKNIANLWRSVWNTPENKNRLKIVVSTQSVNSDTTKRILACQNLYSTVDEVAIAPYLSTPLNDKMTSTDIFSGLNTQITSLEINIKSHIAITNQYNLPLVCYQSGQGLLGSSSITTNLQIGIQTDDRMRSIYVKYFEMLFNNSIVLANVYTDSSPYSGYGSWGTFQYTDQRMSASAKWNGTLQYLNKQNLPISTSQFGKCANNCNGNGICSFGRCVCYGDYNGTNCQISKWIDYVECGYKCTFDQGVCTLNSIVGINRYFSCVCNPGYTGAYCAIPICPGNCNYNGKCTSPNTCTCLRGKMGANCEIDCGCGGHGTCNSDKTCKCDDGFIWNATSKKCQFSCFGQPSLNCYGPNLLKCSNGCVGGTCKNGTCECWPGYTGTDCSTDVPVNYINGNLGINLAGLSYWSTQHLFKDYFKQSSQWIPQYYPGFFNGSIQYTWNTSEKFPTLANGYPQSLALNQSVGKLLLRDINLKYPLIKETNLYVLLYDGEGIIQLGMDAKVYQNSAGRIKFQVTPSTVRDNGVYVQLLWTNPTNPVKNIRVVLQKDQYNYDQDLLSENFMAFIKQFSTIRFMDLLGTNGSPIKDWNQTTRADQDTQALPTGISIDLLTKIIKRTGRNAWINIPHQATDDYVTKLAQYLKSNIPLSRKIYVQYSNQVWNTFFAQGKYAQDQALLRNLANNHKFYAQRSLQIFNIFSSIYGSNSPQLQFVVSFQSVNKWVADQIFTGTNLLGVANIVAGGPYYDCNSIGNTSNAALYATLTAGDVINKCNSEFASLDSILNVQKTVSQSYGVRMATYEAGTSISQQQTIYSGSDNPGATTNFILANRSPDMYSVYKQLLNRYKNAGFAQNAPLMLFSSIGTPSKYGSWGLLDYLDQVSENPTHPKFQAVIDFNLGI